MNGQSGQWLRYAAYGLLLTGLLVGGYYFFYVQYRIEQLSNDRLALLRESSQYFREELTRVQSNIGNTLEDSTIVPDKGSIDDLSASLMEIEGITSTSVENWINQDSPAQGEAEAESSEKGSDVRCRDGAADYKQNRDQWLIEAHYRTSTTRPTLAFRLALAEKYDENNAESRTEKDTYTYTTNETSCGLASAHLDSLLVSLLPRREDAFDRIVLAQKNGKVLVSTGEGALSVVKLPLALGDHPEERAAADTSGDGRHSEIRTMEAAGISHRVFLQPFTVPVEIINAEEDTSGREVSSGDDVLYLAGFKQEQAFRAEARRLPPTLLFVLLGIVAVSLLAFPFLEVWLVGTTETFQAHDILEVAVGVIVSASIATTVLLSLYSSHGLRQEQFEDLEALSSLMRETFHREVEAADRQLTHLTELAKTCILCRKRGDIFVGEARFNPSFPPDPESIVSWFMRSEDQSIFSDSLSYPHFEMSSFIDSSAQQVAKWTVEAQTTPLIDLSSRGYVRAHESVVETDDPVPRRGKVWIREEAGKRKWVFEPIRSKNTGEVFAQISQRTHPIYFLKTEQFDNATSRVAASTLPQISMIEPVLPPGFRFAMIDGSGQVLFHSDTRRNLRENIFDKIRGGDQLRDAVRARRIERGIARYREQAYQFYAHPVAHSPWTLLVFAELDPLETMHGHVLTSGLLLYAGYLFLLGLLLVGFMTWWSLSDRHPFGLRGLLQALWPDPNKVEGYRKLRKVIIGILLVQALLLYIVLFSSEAFYPITVVAATALVALGFFCHGSVRKWSESATTGGEGYPSDWPNVYYWSLFLLVLAIGVLPVAVTYTALHDEAAELLVKKKQRAFAQQVRARGERWVDRYRNIELGSAARDTLSEHLFPAGTWAVRPPGRGEGRCGKSDSVDSWEDVKPGHLLPWDVHTVDGLMTVAVDSTLTSPDGAQVVNRTISRYRLSNAVMRWSHPLQVYSGASSSDSEWSWFRHPESSWFPSSKTCLTFEWPTARRDGLPPDDREARLAKTLRVTSQVPTLAGLQSTHVRSAILLLLLSLFLGGLWTGIRILNDRIFFVDLLPPWGREGAHPNPSGSPDEPTRMLILRGVPEKPDNRPTHPIDAADLDTEWAVKEAVREASEADADLIIVENLGLGLERPEVAKTRRSLLEGLVAGDKSVRVYSDVDPLPYLWDHAPADRAVEEPPDLAGWAHVLKPFDKRSGISDAGNDCLKAMRDRRRKLDLSLDSPVPKQLKFLAEECGSDPYLREEAGPAVAGDPRLENMTEDQIVEELVYRARAHYHDLWRSCTETEKVVLYRISRDGFASPNAREVVARLLRRGLLVKDPEGPVLRPMNGSFRRFVAGLESPVIERYQQEASSMAWNRVRVPLLLGFGVVIVFVFVTQPELAQAAAALAPALAAGLPVVINLLSSVVARGSAMSSGKE